MTRGPRERLLASTIELVREHGVVGTGLAELLAHSRTARGSVYQHFPGGKADLVEAATLAAGRLVTKGIALASTLGDPAAVVGAIVEATKAAITDGDYRLGCPIVAAAVTDNDQARRAAATVFVSWRDALGTALTGTGVSPEQADSFADFAISSVEGALIQARAARNDQPLTNAATYLTALARTLGSPLEEGR